MSWQRALVSTLAMFGSWLLGIGVGLNLGSKNGPAEPLVAATYAIGAVALAYISAQTYAHKKRWGECAVGFAFLLFAANILLPVFQSARAAAATSRCLSNAKQLGLALSLYTNDYDDRLPAAEKWSLVKSYGRDLDQKCPNALAPYDYALNQTLSKLKITDLEDATKTVMVLECAAQTPFPTGAQAQFAKRHGDRGTVAYADGRAKRIKDTPEEHNRWVPK